MYRKRMGATVVGANDDESERGEKKERERTYTPTCGPPNFSTVVAPDARQYIQSTSLHCQKSQDLITTFRDAVHIVLQKSQVTKKPVKSAKFEIFGSRNAS